MIQTQIEKLKDIKLTDLEKHKITIIKYKQNGVDAIVKNVEMYSLQEVTQNEKYKNIFFFEYQDQYNNELWFYDDFGFCSRFIGDINVMKEYDIFMNQLDNYIDNNNAGYENFKKNTIKLMNDNNFISNETIKIFELAGEGQEIIQQLKDYRIEFYRLKEEKEINEREIKLKKEREEIQEEKEKINKHIIEIENKILQGEKVVNTRIYIKNSNNEEIETSLLLHLMKENNIEIPLKTQGWINKALYSIFTGEDGIYTYNYYNTSKNSTVFQKYLTELIEVIKIKNNITLTEEEIKIKKVEQERGRKQKEYKDNIKNIDFEKNCNINRISMDINILQRKNGLYEMSKDEQEEIIKRMCKALKYDDVETIVRQNMILRQGNKNKLTIGKNNTNISVMAIKNNDKIKLYFQKWFTNKNDIHVCIEDVATII